MVSVPVRICPNILQLRPYVPGKPISEVQRELGLEDVIKLASNENPFGPSPKAIAAMAEHLKDLHLYPDASCFELRKKLSDKFQVPPEQILISNGSDEILQLLAYLLIDDPEAEILTCMPSFGLYRAVAAQTRCKSVCLPLDQEGKFDLEKLSKKISSKTKLVYIANPNNPTGTIVTDAALREFIGRLPEGAVLALDEAYFEFATDDPNYPDGRKLVMEGLPVVATRTFSKAYGLAGIRVGYGFAPPEIRDAFDRLRLPFHVNSLAQVGAIAALDDEQHLNKTVIENRRNRDRLEKALVSIGAKVTPSHANFVWAEFDQRSSELFDKLLRQGVIVRPGHLMGADNHVRISVGTEEEIDRFVLSIQALVKAHVGS
jgi:histidinol-phosphate aminotransferase